MAMDSNWAAEHLQVIRTLMERSGVYRRALAPIMIFNGVLGIAAGFLGWSLKISSVQGFIGFWAGTAMIGLAGSFLLVRRQALKDSEPFWSPPTRRVAQALMPPIFIGAVLNTVAGCLASRETILGGELLVLCWLWLYGCAAHSAGFFMTRGMKLFGWIFILVGCALFLSMLTPNWKPYIPDSLLMAATFGGLHLAYGVYLY